MQTSDAVGRFSVLIVLQLPATGGPYGGPSDFLEGFEVMKEVFSLTENAGITQKKGAEILAHIRERNPGVTFKATWCGIVAL